jgi:hypothetical protein
VSEQRKKDLENLAKVLEYELSDAQREMFTAFQEYLQTRLVLSRKQREVLKEVLEKHEPTYENLVSSGKVPLGKPVPTPTVLQNLPKKPPTRRIV